MAKRMVGLGKTYDRAMPSTSLMDEPHYGICLRLTDHELDKLSLSTEGVEKNDLLHIMLMCRVRMFSDGPEGRCVELEAIGGRIENESAEDAADDDGD